MDLKTSKISKKYPSNIKEKKIKTFLSCLELSDNQSKEFQKNKSRLNPDINKKSKEKLNLRKVEITELNQKQKLFNQIIQGKLISNKSKNKRKNKYKKISSIDIINSQNNKKSSYHKKINHSQTKEEFGVVKKIKKAQRPIGRSTVSEVFKIKNPKKNFNLTNLNINYQINNIKTIDTEKAHKSDANSVFKEINKENERIKEKERDGKNKTVLKSFKYIQDDIEINTTQETNNKSERYLSVILFNIKKYKKLYQNFKKENEALKKENEELNNKIQDMKDELDIMKEEIELNKNNDKENENKFKELTEYIKQNEINYEQKIINLKELLFSKDQEINKLNKIIDTESSNKNKIIEELKRKIIEQENIINEQKLLNNKDNNVEKV